MTSIIYLMAIVSISIAYGFWLGFHKGMKIGGEETVQNIFKDLDELFDKAGMSDKFKEIVKTKFDITKIKIWNENK